MSVPENWFYGLGSVSPGPTSGGVGLPLKWEACNIGTAQALPCSRQNHGHLLRRGGLHNAILCSYFKLLCDENGS